MTLGRIAAVVVMLLVGACRAGGPSAAKPPSPQRDLITHAELMASTLSEQDLYQAIQSLRPHFLAPAPGVRPTSASGALSVYVDGVRQAGSATLRSIGAVRVEEVRYLGPVESRNELGVRASGGAIMVKLIKPERDKDPQGDGEHW